MLARTHLAFGLLTALFIKTFVPTENIYIFFALVFLGSLLPDIDKSNSKISQKIPVLPKIIQILTTHRGIFHTLFLAILLPGLLYFFVSQTYGFALFAGYLSHLLIDGLTKSGINFLYPFLELRLAGPIQTGKIAEHVLLVGIVVLCLIMMF